MHGFLLLQWFAVRFSNEIMLNVLQISYDYVAIYDGSVMRGDRLIGTYCDPLDAGNSIVVNGSSALVRFFTDDYVAQGGFKLRYRAGQHRSAAHILYNIHQAFFSRA